MVCPCLMYYCCCKDDDNKKSSSDSTEECTEPVAAASSKKKAAASNDGCCGPDEPEEDDGGCCDCCPCCGPDAPQQTRAAPAPAPVASSPAAAVAANAPVPAGPMGGSDNKTSDDSSSPVDTAEAAAESDSPSGAAAIIAEAAIESKMSGSSGPSTGIAVIDTGIEHRDKAPSASDKKEWIEFVVPEDGYKCARTGVSFDKGATVYCCKEDDVYISAEAYEKEKE